MALAVAHALLLLYLSAPALASGVADSHALPAVLPAASASSPSGRSLRALLAGSGSRLHDGGRPLLSRLLPPPDKPRPFWVALARARSWAASASPPASAAPMDTGAPIAAPARSFLQALLYHVRHLLGLLLRGLWFWYTAMWRTWTATILLAAPVTIMTFAFLYIYVKAGSSRQIDSLYEFNEGLAEVDPAELELDSDEYEFEEDSEAEVPEGSTGGRPLRRAFNLVASHRRQGSRDSAHVVRRRSSLVRITSKDPRSRLCVSPIQLELDDRGRRAKQEMGSMHRDLDGTPTRKRRESGRLTSPVLPQASAEDGGAAVSQSNSLDAAASAVSDPSGEAASEDGDAASLSSLSSLSSGYSTSSAGSFASLQDAPSVIEEVAYRSAAMRLVRRPAPEGPPSILKRLPEVFAGVPQAAAPSPAGLYPSSQGSFNDASVAWNQQGSIRSMDSAAWPFDGSSSSSYVDSSASNDVSATVSSLPPGATHSQNSPLARPSVPRLGSMTPAQVRAAWPGSRRRKSIKLTEPNWALHADEHERARERLETAAQVAAHPEPESLKYVPPRRFESDPRWDFHAAEDSDDDRAEGEFWFERFCQSTAAAGRDWDWRKRRARRAAERARMLGANASTTSLPAMVGGGTPGEEKPALANGVGKTDVQLQQDRQAHARRMRNHQEQLAGPLISFTPGELRPNLSVDVSKKSDPLADAAPASPLGRALKSLRSSSYSGSNASPTEKPMYGSALLQRGSNAPTSPPTYTPALIRTDNDLSGTARIRQSMGKALRKSSVNSNASTRSSASHNRQRRHSDADIRQTEAADSLDVPGRGSSLSAAKQRNKYSSLGRSAGSQLKAESQRERVDSNASWLLAEAALVAADSGSDSDSPITSLQASQRIPEKKRAGALRGAFGVQASPAPAQELHPWDGHIAMLPGSQQAWSSADAYGSLGSAPSTPSLSTPAKQGAGFSPAPASSTARRNGSSKRNSTNSHSGSVQVAPRNASLGVQAANGAVEKRHSLRRLDSPADSSTGSSNSVPVAAANKRHSGVAANVAEPPHLEIRPPVGSRKAILSASSTASGDMNLAARTRVARRPSLRKAAAEAASPRPAPIMQPEPAPFAMAQRARSASISSKSSKSSGSSYPRSETASPQAALLTSRTGPPRLPRTAATRANGPSRPAPTLPPTDEIGPLSYSTDYAAQWRRRSVDASASDSLPPLPRSMLSA